MSALSWFLATSFPFAMCQKEYLPKVERWLANQSAILSHNAQRYTYTVNQKCKEVPDRISNIHLSR